jgi:hypothetical protein
MTKKGASWSRHAASMTLMALVASAMAACAIAEDRHETVILPARAKKLAAGTCDSPFVVPDLSKLKSCGNGRGHCYDGAKLASTSDLPPCEGSEFCVPDKVLTAGGKKLQSCTSMGGKPGVCSSLLLERLEKFKDLVPPDVCDKDNERCAPCINPEDGTDTQACDDTGVHERACAAGGEAAATQTCCHGAGDCINTDAVPEDKRGDMSRETCSEGKLCAPASMTNGTPVKCEALGIPGVCMDYCFAAMLKPGAAVMRGSCGITEMCLPCIVGKGQGVLGCD